MKRMLVIGAVILAGTLGLVDGAAASGGHRGGGHHGHHHGGHSNFGFYFSAPLFWGPGPYYPRPYYPDYYYAPRTVIIEREPPVYIQRQPAPPAQNQVTQLWYYCPNPAGYYPYVQSCPEPWVPVDPRSVPPAAPAPAR